MAEEDAPSDRPRLADARFEPGVRPLDEILDRLPVEPGVYLMKDRKGKVIYVGKAASLRTRVRQYFQRASSDDRQFVPLLEGIVGDIETVVTANEKEALLLENHLIKRHQPRFNVKLTDDKNFLVLRLDPKSEWPRLEVGRRIQDDGAWYFGPYHSATACREALRVVNRHFQLRTCTDHVLHNRKRPCLQYQIKRCPAPCVYDVPADRYGDQVRDVRLFLEGRSEELLTGLRSRMKDAAGRTEYERAAEVRDQIAALESTLQSQRVVSTDFIDQDVIGFHREGLGLEMVVMAVRQGKLVGSRSFSFGGQEFPDDELLSSFVGLYYDLGVVPPDEVLLPIEIEDAALKAGWLGERRTDGRKVAVLTPKRGARRALVELARKNAAASFATRRSKQQDAEVMLGKLQRRLKLPRLPRVIECYDVSHIQGFATVASMVVFVDGRPDKTRYRTYKVRTATGDPDDFASMYEVLSRRFRRAREGDEGWALPDLIVIDGGKGQLGMALAAARDVGIDVRPGTGLPIVGLAKERTAALPSPPVTGQEERTAALPFLPSPSKPERLAPLASPPMSGQEERTAALPSPPAPGGQEMAKPAAGGEGKAERARDPGPRVPDRVFLPQAKDAIPIRPNSAEMFVLQHLRDEAHRFAVSFHRGERRRRTLRSALAAVSGIGPARQRLLLRHFGSVKKIREASVDDMAAVPGMTRPAAEAVAAFLAARPDETAGPPGGAPAGQAPTADEAAAEDAIESAFAGVEGGGQAAGDIGGEAGETEEGEVADNPVEEIDPGPRTP